MQQAISFFYYFNKFVTIRFHNDSLITMQSAEGSINICVMLSALLLHLAQHKICWDQFTKLFVVELLEKYNKNSFESGLYNQNLSLFYNVSFV